MRRRHVFLVGGVLFLSRFEPYGTTHARLSVFDAFLMPIGALGSLPVCPWKED